MPSTNPPSLALIVLRVADIGRAADFYSVFGMSFEKHAHGKGPEHYAANLGEIVFEIYPQTTEENSTRHVRIGFRVSDVKATLQALEEKGGTIISVPKESAWGLRAVIDDPFGHRIELTQTEPAA